jgi:hypothetical protein
MLTQPKAIFWLKAAIFRAIRKGKLSAARNESSGIFLVAATLY